MNQNQKKPQELKILGIVALKDGKTVFIPSESIQIDDSAISGIVDTPTPEQESIAKEKERDYTLAGILKNAKKD